MIKKKLLVVDIVDHKGVDDTISNLKKRKETRSILVADLTDSVYLKKSEGHSIGVNEALKFILICIEIVESIGGKVVKETGDGLIATFTTPFNACKAALNINASVIEHGMQAKCAISSGTVESCRINRQSDIYGIAIDRAVRIKDYCLPSQILVDYITFGQVESELLDYTDVNVSDPITKTLKGIGETKVYEITTDQNGLSPYLNTPFTVHGEGRIPTTEKALFVKDAQSEVYEVGLGLTSFSNWFVSHRSSEFRSYFEELLVRGVNVSLLALDPNWDITRQYFDSRGELEYIDKIHNSLDILRGERKRLLKLRTIKGKFQIYLYQYITSMHILCVDPNNYTYGRMLFSPYLAPDTQRSESPVYEMSIHSNEVTFNKYFNMIKYIINKKAVIDVR